jgi:hypothetical protein
MVSHLLPFMVDITHSILFWVYLNNYCTTWMCYICPGPVFQCEFNCDVNLGFGLTCFGNFENWQIYIYAFCTIFQCEVNYNVCSVIGLTCFGNFECVYTFCAIFPCKFNYNVCLVIKITSFGNFQNQYIVICILYQFLM